MLPSDELLEYVDAGLEEVVGVGMGGTGGRDLEENSFILPINWICLLVSSSSEASFYVSE